MMDGESNRGSAAEERGEWIYIDWIQAEVITTSWHLDQYRLLTVRYKTIRHLSIELCASNIIDSYFSIGKTVRLKR